jgi:putative ABC transport system permease protein
MQIRPIVSAMRRNKVGAVLIALQMAVTLAILCNALFIITQRLALMARPSGLDEADILTLRSDWIGQPDDLLARQQADLAALRALPDVADAYITNSVPLGQSGWLDGIDLKPDQKHSTADSTIYMVDEHALDTLGVRLVAGRNFTAEDVKSYNFGDNIDAGVVIVTRALADKLFPGADPLGRAIYLEDHMATIVGVIERLQTPWVSGSDSQKFVEHSLLAPLHPLGPSVRFIVRARPGRAAALLQQVQQALLQVNHARVLSLVKPFSQVRAEAYRDDRGLAIILGVVCVSLLGITVFGIVGLTSFWVTQRRRQIGVRRALGATRRAILGYFQTENLLIAAAGTLLGAALAVGLNLWMVSAFEMQRMQAGYVVGAVAAILLLGQFAVLWPALRAASIPPALATRAT